MKEIDTRIRFKNLAYCRLDKQEAPLTLIGLDSAAVAKILKENRKYLEASLAQGYAHFSTAYGFIVGLGKPKLCTTFEVASFSHRVNIKGNPQILGSTPSPGPCVPFVLRVILSWALPNPSCMPNVKTLAQPLQKYYRGTPKFWGAPLAQGMMGMGKPQLHAKFEVAGFIYYGNIRQFVLNKFAFLATLWGVRGNVRTSSIAR